MEEIQNKELLNLINTLEDDRISNNTIEFSKNKAIYANTKLSNIFKDYSGKNYLDDISNKLKLNNLNKNIIPCDLKASLRDYQIYGLKWFNELSSLGFGGILGDEMGLGKTVQAISFILSNRGKKTIIITPTSLIYNWRDEFLKFAPSLKIAIVNETKKKRLDIIENYKNYDVILTTYNLFRIDSDNYKDTEFD